LKAEKSLQQINYRLAEVEQQLGVTSLKENKGSDKPLVFGYWAIRGLAQPIRLLLVYLNVAFTERRYLINPPTPAEDWFKEKNNLDVPFPNLPYLFDGDIKLTQSHAILFYIARTYGPHLAGLSVAHQAEVEMLIGVVYDFREKWANLCYDSKFDQRVGKYKDETLPAALKQFSTYLNSKGNVFFTGSKLTVVDFILYEVLDANRILSQESFSPFPNLLKFLNRIEELPAIATYMKTKDFISRPINNTMAAFK